eukprot:6101969-Prorocentrum_lima.AAC.1
MTSSLVGSEMCIRDSPNGEVGGAPPAEVRQRFTPREETPILGQASAATCLLYTSDAADDM